MNNLYVIFHNAVDIVLKYNSTLYNLVNHMHDLLNAYICETPLNSIEIEIMSLLFNLI